MVHTRNMNVKYNNNNNNNNNNDNNKSNLIKKKGLNYNLHL